MLLLLLTPKTVLLIHELKEVKDWFGLGVHLGLDSVILKSIDGRNKNVEECMRDMLITYIDAYGIPSWITIVKILKEMGEDGLAHELHERFGGWT